MSILIQSYLTQFCYIIDILFNEQYFNYFKAKFRIYNHRLHPSLLSNCWSFLIHCTNANIDQYTLMKNWAVISLIANRQKFISALIYSRLF